MSVKFTFEDVKKNWSLFEKHSDKKDRNLGVLCIMKFDHDYMYKSGITKGGGELYIGIKKHLEKRKGLANIWKTISFVKGLLHLI